MTIETILRDAGLTPWVDARAAHRASYPPKKLEVVSLGSVDDTSETITEAVSLDSAAMVLVMRSGGVLVLTNGGYGPIAVQGPLDSMTDEQAATLAVVTEALSAAFGLDAGVKKKSRKKADEVVVEVISDDPEIVAVTEEVTE